MLSTAGALASIAAAGGARHAPTVIVGGVRYSVSAVRPTSRGIEPSVVAVTDATLLHLSSSRPVPVLIKLADQGLAVQLGARLTRLGASRRASYLRTLTRRDAAFASTLVAAVPSAEVGRSLRVVYGGLAAVVPGNAVRTILHLPGVVAVQRDVLRHATATSAASLAGVVPPAPAEPDAAAGAGAVVAMIDSGLWPEHPALAETSSLAAPRPTRSGAPRICNFGDDPATAAVDPFLCNRKVLGGDVFLDRYRDVIGLGSEPFPTSARDGDGHGTSTATIAAGDVSASAPLGGIERGPFAGVAPGASLLAYKALSRGYGYDSDIVAAIDRAVAEGADVIVLPISGPRGDVATDPVALALLDAATAGVSVIAAAGNDGPTAGTVENTAPWILTVGSSSADGSWRADVTLSAGQDSVTLAGAGVGGASSGAQEVKVAGSLGGYAGGADCHAPAATGTLTNTIAVCTAGGAGLAAQARNVQSGGASGLVVLDVAAPSPLALVLPAVLLDRARSDQLRAFLGAHTSSVALIGAATRTPTPALEVSPFSGRGGPRLAFLKPNLLAAGGGLLAGTTPLGDAVTGAPAGALYDILTGTSAAAATAAGSLAVVRSRQPGMTSAEAGSALALTALTATENGSAASTFSSGSGVIDLKAALAPGLVLDVAPASFAAATNGAARLALNLPSVLVPEMPATTSFVRTARNVSGVPLSVTVTLDPMPGVTATARPSATTIPVGGTLVVTVDADASAALDGTLSGALHIHAVEPVVSAPVTPRATPASPWRAMTRDRGHHGRPGRHGGDDDGSGKKDSDNDGDDDEHDPPVPPPPLPITHDLRLPIVLVRRSAPLTVSVACLPTTIVGDGVTPARCTVAVPNPAALAGTVHVHTTVSGPLHIASATGVTVAPDGSIDLQSGLSGPGPVRPTVTNASPASDPGFLDLSLSTYGVPATPIGLNDALELSNVGSFQFAGRSWDRLAVTSNGTIIAGGGASTADRTAAATAFPDPARPNGVLAPYWTALDGTGAPGVRVARLSGGGKAYLVIQWDVRVAGTTLPRTFEVWLGQNGTEEITFAYDQARLPRGDGLAGPLSIGAENADGTAGDGLGLGVAPVGDLHVSSTAGAAPIDVGFSFDAVGAGPGVGWVITTLDLLGAPGETVDRQRVAVSVP